MIIEVQHLVYTEWFSDLQTEWVSAIEVGRRGEYTIFHPLRWIVDATGKRRQMEHRFPFAQKTALIEQWNQGTKKAVA